MVGEGKSLAPPPPKGREGPLVHGEWLFVLPAKPFWRDGPEVPSLNNLFCAPVMALSLLLSFKMKTFGDGVKDHLSINIHSKPELVYLKLSKGHTSEKEVLGAKRIQKMDVPKSNLTFIQFCCPEPAELRRAWAGHARPPGAWT